MFQYISVEKFLRLFACFLLEHQILLCSKGIRYLPLLLSLDSLQMLFLPSEYSRLMCVSEALCALAFPFRWQMVYVPILPYSQLKFVEAPVSRGPYRTPSLFSSNVCIPAGTIRDGVVLRGERAGVSFSIERLCSGYRYGSNGVP